MTNRIRAFAAIAGMGAILCGCASRPENIPAAYVSPVAYVGMSCPQLGSEETRVNAAYSVAARAQKHTRAKDTGWVLLTGLPIGSMQGGDVSAEIANLKGQLNAIHQTEIQKKCIPVS